MIKSNFLKKIIREGKLKETIPSDNIKDSYLIKSENCLKSAKILAENSLHENSTSEAYYCMYNALLALLFKCGIKSENHSISIWLLDSLFKQRELYLKILESKSERIDKQYYTDLNQKSVADSNTTLKIISDAEHFLIEIKIILNNLNNRKLSEILTELRKMLIV